MKKMKSEKAYPGARRMIEGVSDLGYETHTAIADLIDNSISAKASSVFIDIEFDEEKSPFIFIADNGIGMSKDKLLDSMRFGAFQIYDKSALGKYGLGLKSASLSQCRCLTVISRAKPTKGARPRTVMARWDMQAVEENDEWDLLIPENEDLKPCEQALVEKYLGDGHGTIVIWSNLRDGFSLLKSKNEDEKNAHLSKILGDVLDHVSMVFHRFLEGADLRSKRLKIQVSGADAVGWDPFCRKEKNTQEYDPVVYELEYKKKNYEVIVRPFNIPREDEFSSKEEAKKAKGTAGFNNHQGFYFYRSGRLLKMGGWSNMRILDEHTKLTRVAIDFPNDLDELFAINITKMRAKIPAQIFDELKDDSAKWVSDGRKRYDKERKSKSKAKSGKSTSSPAAAVPPRDYKLGKFSISPSNARNKTSVISNPKGNDNISIAVSTTSPFYSLVSGSGTKNGDLRKLIVVLLSYLENVKDGKKKPSEIPLDALIKKAKELV